jgi:hypothetical protein
MYSIIHIYTLPRPDPSATLGSTRSVTMSPPTADKCLPQRPRADALGGDRLFSHSVVMSELALPSPVHVAPQ